jgi:hypothetical protein
MGRKRDVSFRRLAVFTVALVAVGIAQGDGDHDRRPEAARDHLDVPCREGQGDRACSEKGRPGQEALRNG